LYSIPEYSDGENLSSVNERETNMAKCAITGKKKSFGLKRSFSMRRINRAWKPNLQRRRMVIDGRMQTVMVSTKALRTLAKAER
jgi:large subunit ribosomal protein L28